jgi:Fic family protein
MGINENEININQKLIKRLGELDSFNGYWPILKKKIEHELGNLKHVSTIASIGSSTRIEGVQMSDQEIDQFLDDINETSFLSRDKQEVLGYKELLDQIIESHDEIAINENLIKQLHKILLSHSSKDEFHLGYYKKFDNNVIAKKEGKEIGVVFKTTSPFNTPKEMETLLNWYNQANDIHPLIKCAVFIVHFLAIHPFQDGNGRLSRALTTLILLKEGYSYAPYCSLESIIEANKTNYYKALRDTQKSFFKKINYEPWLDFFFESLKKQQTLLSEKGSLVTYTLTKTQKHILEFAESVNAFQNSDVSESLNMNKNTVKVNLKKLVDIKLLSKEGIGKGTWYKTINPY